MRILVLLSLLNFALNLLSFYTENMADKDDKAALIKYRTEFDKWLGEFKTTADYAELVNHYQRSWSPIYKELNAIFKEKIWYPSKMRSREDNDDDKKRYFPEPHTEEEWAVIAEGIDEMLEKRRRKTKKHTGEGNSYRC